MGNHLGMMSRGDIFNPRKMATWIESQTLLDHGKFTVHLSNSTNHFLKFHGTETSWATRPFHSAAILYPWLKSLHHTWETKNASLWQDHKCIPEGCSKLLFYRKNSQILFEALVVCIFFNDTVWEAKNAMEGFSFYNIPFLPFLVRTVLVNTRKTKKTQKTYIHNKQTSITLK